MDEARAREMLQAERAEVSRLLADVTAAAEADLVNDGPGDDGDAAVMLSAESADSAVATGLQGRLDSIDRALARLDAGTYGHSVLSGKPIPDQRLAADPAAELTIEESRARR